MPTNEIAQAQMFDGFTPKPKCPKCHRRDSVKEIVYGYLAAPPEPGQIPGGCVIEDDSPSWRCIRCSHDFGRWGEPDPELIQ